MATTSGPDTGARPALAPLIGGAVRFWEPRRALYNLVLVAVVLGHVSGHPLGASPFAAANDVLTLFVFAVWANVLYCSAYVADLFLQLGRFVRLTMLRWSVFAIGTAFAAALAHLAMSGFYTGR